MKLQNIINKSIIELSRTGVSNTPDLDVGVLLKHVLDSDVVYLISHPDALLTNAQYQKFRRLIRRRKKGEPVAYLVGHKEFYGLGFIVNKNVLVPRPETEQLIELSTDFIIKRPITNDRQLTNILDMGTGSGCIIISLIRALQPAIIHNSSSIIRFFASDISQKALTVAKRNAKKHGIYDNIRFYQSDLFNNKKLHRKYNLIIANLPYVPKTKSRIKNQESSQRSIGFEPKTAIFADNNGEKIIRKFLSTVKYYININGLILIELDPRNAKKLLQYSNKLFPQAKIELAKDLQGLDRIISILYKII